jgi:hypothetical protein
MKSVTLNTTNIIKLDEVICWAHLAREDVTKHVLRPLHFLVHIRGRIKQTATNSGNDWFLTNEEWQLGL